MKFSFRKRGENEKKEEIDFLTLALKQKAKRIAFFQLKWGSIILVTEIIIWILLDVSKYSGVNFFTQSLLYIPGIFLILGGCMGGLSRYHIPPKMRIVEPDDQSVAPSNFQIRVKFEPNAVNGESISILINNKKLPSTIDTENNVVIVRQIFKNPPKKAVSILIEVFGKMDSDKEIKDKIRIICDPEADEEDYLEYWEFKREDQTYWGKELRSANRHAKRNLSALSLIILSAMLLLLNYLVSLLYPIIKSWIV